MEDRSKSGEWIKRHDQATPGEPTSGDPELIDKVGDHVAKHLGDFDVLHEIVSTHVHLDVFRVPPQRGRDFHVLVTCGSSERPMTGAPEEDQYIELAMLLPSHWPMTESAFMDEKNYWPVRQLKTLGRFPHVYQTWLGFGHTVGNGEPPQPFDISTKLCGSLIFASLSLPREFHELRAMGRTTRFYCVIPIYAEEMFFKLDHGLDPLIDRLERYKVSDVLSPQRINCVTGRLPDGSRLPMNKPWWKLWS